MLNVLVMADEIVTKHYNGNPDEWQAVVKAIYTLMLDTDMDNFLGYCNYGEYSLSEGDRDGVTDLRVVFDINNKDKDGHEDVRGL